MRIEGNYNNAATKIHIPRRSSSSISGVSRLMIKLHIQVALVSKIHGAAALAQLEDLWRGTHEMGPDENKSMSQE